MLAVIGHIQQTTLTFVKHLRNGGDLLFLSSIRCNQEHPATPFCDQQVPLINPAHSPWMVQPTCHQPDFCILWQAGLCHIEAQQNNTEK